MKTLIEFASRLDSERILKKMPKSRLAERTGVTNKTVQGFLKGENDARLSTIISMAHVLGLELVLVPKEIAASIEATGDRGVRYVPIQSLVDNALEAKFIKAP